MLPQSPHRKPKLPPNPEEMEDPLVLFPAPQAWLSIGLWSIVALRRLRKEITKQKTCLLSHLSILPLMCVTGDGLSHCLSSKFYPGLVSRVISSRLRDFPFHISFIYPKEEKIQREIPAQQFLSTKRISNMKWWDSCEPFQCKFHAVGAENIRGVSAAVLLCPTKQQLKSVGMAKPTSSSSNR